MSTFIESQNLKVVELPWQRAGLTWTATGYGAKIPTRYMVRTFGNRWRRVYCAIFGNAGTCYVLHGKFKHVVDFDAR